MEARVSDIGNSGAIGFNNKFTRPPVIVASIMRYSYNASYSAPVFFYITNVGKHCFSYVAQNNEPGDKVSWIAVEKLIQNP